MAGGIGYRGPEVGCTTDLMKNHNRARKLPLGKETIRALDQIELGDVAGGNVTSTVQPTNVVCSKTCG
jgi:hypothetical protein